MQRLAFLAKTILQYIHILSPSFPMLTPNYSRTQPKLLQILTRPPHAVLMKTATKFNPNKPPTSSTGYVSFQSSIHATLLPLNNMIVLSSSYYPSPLHNNSNQDYQNFPYLKLFLVVISFTTRLPLHFPKHAQNNSPSGDLLPYSITHRPENFMRHLPLRNALNAKK